MTWRAIPDRLYLKDQKRLCRERHIVIERTREEWRAGHAALSAEKAGAYTRPNFSST